MIESRSMYKCEGHGAGVLDVGYSDVSFSRALLLQKPTVPVYVDDGAPWAGPRDWPDATATTGSRIAGVEYESLNRTLSRYFEDPALVNNAHTKAIVVIYQARPGAFIVPLFTWQPLNAT